MNCFSLIGLITFSLLCEMSFAQKKQSMYFLKNNGSQVKLKDSADFIRVIQEPDSGSTFYNLYEYYQNGNKKRLGKLSSFDPKLIFEESLASYYPNGKKEEIAVYARGKTRGTVYNYYPNGQLKKTSVNETAKNNLNILGINSKIISYYDSTGVELVKEGTGYYKTFAEEGDLIEEGSYVDSVKHGAWKGSFIKRNASYEEQYDHGKFIEGESKLNDEAPVKYTKIEEMPSFKGGIEKFLQYIGRNYRYPREASIQKISGKIIVSFVVEQNGSLTNLKVLKDLGAGTGAEALRIVRQSPTWIPGRQHGIPVRFSYTLPIHLKTQ
ncbi:TonB family protein [Pedobacter sp. P351]|uniref:TonB family protein n=1 Tax=Pedobacter superstes TaxID=3133441 RepID=UPI00309647EF